MPLGADTMFRVLSRVYAPPPIVVCTPWPAASPPDDIKRCRPLRSIKRPTPDRDNSQGHKMSTAYSTNPITNPTPQTHDANGFARPGKLRHRAIPMRTGHHRQPDGSVVRVDIEMGRWVGSLYTPEMEIKTRIIGSELEVHAWADRILVHSRWHAVSSGRLNPNHGIDTKVSTP
jgi:hypothetical protein